MSASFHTSRPSTGEIVDRMELPIGPSPEIISAAGGSLWVSDGVTPILVRYEVPRKD